jgi:small-conductance mechanosensitive channel
MTSNEILYLSIYIGGGLAAGWLIQQTIIPALKKIAKKTKWKSDDLIITNISRWIVFWFFLLGCLLGAQQVELSEKWSGIVLKIISSLFIFSLTWIIARIAAGMLDIRSSKDDSVIPSTSIIGNILKVIIYCIGLMVILQSLGVSVTPILTALGVGGLAVALALQPTLSNLFSGLQIIASGKLNVGDMVQLENGQRGIITDITWRNTTIRTAQNNIVIVPNSKMADSIVENYNLTDQVMEFSVTVGVSYDSNLDLVERVSVEVAKEVLQKMEEGVNEAQPYVRFFNFGQHSIDLKIFLTVKDFAGQFPVASEFIKALQKRYKQEGIQIPFPIRTVIVKNENT